jgi:hypothetical protein
MSKLKHQLLRAQEAKKKGKQQVSVQGVLNLSMQHHHRRG